MIRYTLLWLFVFGLMRYAWRDWCKSLCILLTMLAVLERPDMPKHIFGIQGLNPFNVALAGILVAWFAQPREKSDVPRWFTVLFSLYIAVMVISTARLMLNPSYLMIFQHPIFEVHSRGSLVAEYVVNTFKWVVPAILLVRGCRGAERQRWLIVGVLGIYAVLAFLVMRQMPLGYLLDGERLQQRAADILQRRVGYHRVDLATMFAGASWAMLAVRPLFPSGRIRLALVGLFAMTALGLALTGGRAGYLTWCALGLILSVLKWRRLLLLAPVAVAAVLIVAPGVPQRMLQGLTGRSTDEHLVTSGRNVVWPAALEKIRQAPIAGWGRQAWARTNVRMQVGVRTGEFFGHPHNAYFEFALDNGLIGMAILLPMFGLIVLKSARMFCSRGDPAVEAAGGAALAMTLGFLIASASAQTFYPTEGSVGMWCMIALAFRVSQERAAVRAVVAAPVPVTPIGSPQLVPEVAEAWQRPGGKSVTLWPEGQRR